MSANYLGYLAAILYLLSALSILQKQLTENKKGLSVVISSNAKYLAIVCHAINLFLIVHTQDGTNLSIFNSASIVALIISTIIVLGSRLGSITTTALVAFPLSSIFIIVSINYPLENSFTSDNIGIKMHIVLSFLAYSFFSVAIIQAFFLLITEYRLKTHRPIMNLLPPLRLIEDLMFFSTTVAFILLTGGLFIGIISIDNIFEQHLTHKIFFSMLAWLIFLFLLIGRIKYQLRGKKAAYLMIGGFILLATGFFGSKFVLEILLGKS